MHLSYVLEEIIQTYKIVQKVAQNVKEIVKQVRQYSHARLWAIHKASLICPLGPLKLSDVFSAQENQPLRSYI